MYRSAGAEYILRKKLAEARIDDWIVDSAGTLQLNRTRRPEDFGRILAEKGYEFGGATKYVYDAGGSKLRTIHEALTTNTTDYIGDFIFEDGKPSKYQFEGSYCSFDSNLARMHKKKLD